MKNFAIIINFEEKQSILAKTKTRTLASSRFEAVCNISSSAVDRRDALGIGSPTNPTNPNNKKATYFRKSLFVWSPC